MIKIYNKDGVILNTKNKICTENLEITVDTADLTPENILKGKRILGVSGAAETTVVEGGIIPEGEITLTKEGTFDVTEYASAKVEVEKEEKTITPTKNTINVYPSGSKFLKKVVVNPIPPEYIWPSGITGATANGRYDCTKYEWFDVNVPETIPEGYILPSGNFEITANGDYDISDKETVSVNVATGGGDSLWKDIMDGRGNNWNYLLAYSKITDATPYLAGYDNPSSILHMCDNCSNLTTVPFFNTSNITNATYMFYNCSNLKSVPNYDTSKVTDISYIFYNSGLETMPNWDTSKVTTFNYAFYGTKLKEAVVNTDSATNISSMFQNAQQLERAEISSMDRITSQYSVSSYANGCYSLKQFIIRNMTKVPVFYNSSYSYPFNNSHHIVGTFDRLYNPEGLQDGGIYVPDEWVEPMKAATGWSMYGDIIYPISELPEGIPEITIPYITSIVDYSSPWTMTTDKYYFSNGTTPRSKFVFTVPENATSTSLTFEVTVDATSTSTQPSMVIFGKLDTEIANLTTVSPDNCQDYKELPENQIYTVTYNNLTPGEHFIYIGARVIVQSTANTQHLKFRRIYE